MNNSAFEQDKLLTKDELAGILGIKRRGVECLMKGRKIPYIKLGGRIRFKLSHVLEAIGRLEVKAIR